MRNDVDRLHVSRKEGERILTSIEDTVDVSIQRLEVYIKTRNSTNNIKANRARTRIPKKNGKKNNCKDISSNKLTTSHTRSPGPRLEKGEFKR